MVSEKVKLGVGMATKNQPEMDFCLGLKWRGRRREGEDNRWPIKPNNLVFAFEAILRQQPLFLTVSRFIQNTPSPPSLPLSLSLRQIYFLHKIKIVTLIFKHLFNRANKMEFMVHEKRNWIND